MVSPIIGANLRDLAQPSRDGLMGFVNSCGDPFWASAQMSNHCAIPAKQESRQGIEMEQSRLWPRSCGWRPQPATSVSDMGLKGLWIAQSTIGPSRVIYLPSKR